MALSILWTVHKTIQFNNDKINLCEAANSIILPGKTDENAYLPYRKKILIFAFLTKKIYRGQLKYVDFSVVCISFELS